MRKGRSKTVLLIPGKSHNMTGKEKNNPLDTKQECLRFLKKTYICSFPSRVNLQHLIHKLSPALNLSFQTSAVDGRAAGRAEHAVKSPSTTAEPPQPRQRICLYILQITGSFHNPGSEKFLSHHELSYS